MNDITKNNFFQRRQKLKFLLLKRLYIPYFIYLLLYPFLCHIKGLSIVHNFCSKIIYKNFNQIFKIKSYGPKRQQIKPI